MIEPAILAGWITGRLGATATGVAIIVLHVTDKPLNAGRPQAEHLRATPLRRYRSKVGFEVIALAGWRRQHGPGLPFAAAALSIVLAMPMARSIGSTLVRGNAGFPSARPPFPAGEVEARRGRWAHLAGAIAGDPKLIAFLEHHHGREDYLLATVNARQAAPIIIATGNPVMALGGFSGGDPILTVDDFARLVAENRVRFALIGDGSEGIRRIFSEARQKPLTDWIQANGKRVDVARWRTPITTADPGAADGRPLRGRERRALSSTILRPADDDGG
jgi:4-amino-4-deoxy-L-arabinose transferase-like glycosyltransferase